jgi:hypothetical protein
MGGDKMINKTISLLLTLLMIAGPQVKYPETVKILSIGNSFSQDALYYLYDIAESAGINVVIGNLYYSGGSLKTHEANAKNNLNAYSYHKWTSEGMTEAKNKTMKEIILDEKWDYITFQQSSEDSGLYGTYQPYLNNLISYVKSLQPDAKFALNMTWAYSTDSGNNGFANYNYNQFNMYRSITEAYKQALDETEIDILIPCGTAIQNSRTNEQLSAIGDQLTSDGYHLDEGMGRYIAGLTFFEALIVRDKNLDLNIYEDVTFIPSTITSTEELANVAKKAVIEAIKDPYITTKLELTK